MWEQSFFWTAFLQYIFTGKIHKLSNNSMKGSLQEAYSSATGRE